MQRVRRQRRQQHLGRDQVLDQRRQVDVLFPREWAHQRRDARGVEQPAVHPLEQRIDQRMAVDFADLVGAVAPPCMRPVDEAIALADTVERGVDGVPRGRIGRAVMQFLA